MKIHKTYFLNEDISFSIVEANDNILNKINNRFEVALEYKGKRHFPLLKRKFFEFESTREANDISLNENVIILDDILYHELKICDKSLNECTDQVNHYLTLYKDDLNKIIKTYLKHYE